MNDIWVAIVGICGGILAIAGVVSLAWWLVKPRITDYIENEVAAPIRETRHQVTVNSHSSASPTVLDLLADLRAEIRANAREVESVQANVTDLTELLVDHLRSNSD